MRLRNPLPWGVAAAAVAVSLALTASAGAVTSSVVYNATPNPLPPNVASVGFEATSTSEFGDQVNLGGTNRVLSAVTVTMSDWALFSDYASDARYSGNPSTWSHPITVNVYANHLGLNGAPDTLLATTTQDVVIPWRPVADPTCPGGTAWRASDLNCYNGIAINAAFDFSSQHITLPSQVIVGIAYNTADYGAAPIHVAGPYNSLNVGAPTNQTVTVGSDANTDAVFWNTSFAGFYADGGSAGVGIFRQDTNWTPNGTAAIQITASAPPQLIGTTTLVRPAIDSDAHGSAEAFRAVATASGTATTLNVYVDPSNTAARLVAGIYADNGSGHPGALLGQGTLLGAPVNGAFNTILIGSSPLVAGTPYWITVLSPLGDTGTFRFDDHCCGHQASAPNGPSESSKLTNLTTLPASWSTGPVWPHDGLLLAYGG